MSHFISFTVVGTPVGKGRPRVSTRSGFVRTYTPERTREYETLVADVALAERVCAGLVPTIDDVSVSLDFFFPVPKSYSKSKRQACLADELKPKKYDIDNLCKSVLDGMNGVIFLDDKQVCELHARQFFTDEAIGFVRVEVNVF